MRVFDETLDSIARSGEAVFAIDGANRIILWNKACEQMLGRPARRVLGKLCYEIMCGRDVYGNLYCHHSCPVAFQAREKRDDPVNRFQMTVSAGEAKTKRVSSSLFSIPSYHPALTTVVHVLREEPERLDAEAPERAQEPLTPLLTGEGRPVALTEREKGILRCLKEGMTTEIMAKKLSIAPVTVRNHVQNILQKLDVHTKLAAVVLANRHQLI